MPEIAWIMAPTTSPSSATWPSISFARSRQRAPCASRSSGPDGRTHISPKSSLKSEMRSPCTGGYRDIEANPLSVPAVSLEEQRGHGLQVRGEIDARQVIGAIEQFLRHRHGADAPERVPEVGVDIRDHAPGLQAQQAEDGLHVVPDAVMDLSEQQVTFGQGFLQAHVAAHQL